MGAIERDAPELEQLHLPSQLEHLEKSARHRLEVAPAKSADRIVIGVMIRAEVTHRHIAISGPLDAAAAKDAIGIAMDKQREPFGPFGFAQGTRRLRAYGIQCGGYCSSPQPFTLTSKAESGSRSTAPMMKWTRSSPFDFAQGLRLGDPFAQVHRQEHGSLTVDVLETLSHVANVRSEPARIV